MSDEKIKEYKPKCPKCKRIVEKPNRLVPIWEGSKTLWCLICIEDMTHEEIVDYLEGKSSGTFVCGEDGCNYLTPKRDYLQTYTDQELLCEIAKRLEE